MDGVRLHLLGGLEVRVGSGAAAIPLPARKAAALLAYLALHPGRPQPRERLAGLFWEDSAEPQARASLRQALTLLRRVPGFGAALSAAGDAVALRPGWASTDVAAFEAAAAGPDLLARAASLYRGELLAGLRLRSAAFESWLVPERARLHGCATAAMRALLDGGAGDAEERVALALRLLQLDPAQEEVHRALIRLHARRGRHEAALRQFQACREALRRELDVAPGAETEGLVRDIRARRAAACRRPAPAAVATVGQEPRSITVLWAELDGAGRPRPAADAPRRAQAELFRAVSRAVELHGGDAGTSAGAAVMAVFGAPAARRRRRASRRRGAGGARAARAGGLRTHRDRARPGAGGGRRARWSRLPCPERRGAGPSAPLGGPGGAGGGGGLEPGPGRRRRPRVGGDRWRAGQPRLAPARPRRGGRRGSGPTRWPPRRTGLRALLSIHRGRKLLGGRRRKPRSRSRSKAEGKTPEPRSTTGAIFESAPLPPPRRGHQTRSGRKGQAGASHRDTCIGRPILRPGLPRCAPGAGRRSAWWRGPRW